MPHCFSDIVGTPFLVTVSCYQSDRLLTISVDYYRKWTRGFDRASSIRYFFYQVQHFRHAEKRHQSSTVQIHSAVKTWASLS